MNVATKQRLVGTIVLVSLAMILIPLLLDGEGVEPPPAAITQSIPPAPLVDTTPLPEPVRPLIVADAAVPTAADDQDLNIDPTLDAAAATQPDATAAPDDSVPEPATPGAESPQVTDVAPEPDAAADAQGPTPPPGQAAPVPAPQADIAVNTPELDARGLPAAWTVQMGMFSDKANAEALLARLLLANYKAYLRPQGSGLSGVFVGPVPTRTEANDLQREMQSEFGEGLVTRFQIAPPQ